MRKILLLLLFSLVFSLEYKLNAQTCFGNFAGNDINLPCSVTCTPFSAKIPEIRSTEDYLINSIPYTPYPYRTAAPGLMVGCPNQDDKFFDKSDLPFPFCFYGQTYNSLVVGTNGLLSFDLSNALDCNQWDMTAGSGAAPIPFAGTGSQCGTNCPQPVGVLYPRASIMGVYQDIDIDNPSPGKKMEFRIEGTAPCRRAVISFNAIRNFSCAGISTTEIVIYESTGIIEVYIQDKPSGCPWNDDAAILGIQNWNRDKGLAPPGRNLGSWGSVGMNEAWQFKPNGANSLLDHVVLLLNGVVVANGTIGALNNGLYDVDFGNICPPSGINSYVVRGYYKICNDNATTYFIEDTVQINRIAPFSTNGSTVNPLCFGLLTGQVTFNPIGITGPYLFSNDMGVTYQTGNIFSGLAAGSYIFRIKDINNCFTDTTIIITQPPLLTASALTIASTCNGNDGTITVTASGGTIPYQYSINNGLNFQSSNIFTVAPGVYDSIVVRDTNNCIANTTVVVSLSDTMRLVIGPDSTICVGKSVTFAPQTNAQTNIFKWTAAPTLLQTEIDKDSIANATVTPPVTKKYYLRAKWGLCQRVDSIVINVLNKPIAFAGNDTTICAKTPAFLHGSAFNTSGPVLYTWAPITPLLTFVSPDSSQAVALPDSSQEYIFNVRDNYGCNFSVFDTMKVFIDPPVPAFAGNDTNAVLGQPHQLFATGGVSYMWSPSVNLNNPFAQNPRATLFNDTYFRVTVTDAIGCSGFDDVFIKVYEGPTYYVPNAFTPNKDGLNELFRPIPVGMAQTDYFMVFDRYGTLVFQTNQWLKGWDGTIKGKDALMGTYVWMVKGKDKIGKVVQMKGTVLLMR